MITGFMIGAATVGVIWLVKAALAARIPPQEIEPTPPARHDTPPPAPPEPTWEQVYRMAPKLKDGEGNYVFTWAERADRRWQPLASKN